MWSGGNRVAHKMRGRQRSAASCGMHRVERKVKGGTLEIPANPVAGREEGVNQSGQNKKRGRPVDNVGTGRVQKNRSWRRSTAAERKGGTQTGGVQVARE